MIFSCLVLKNVYTHSRSPGGVGGNPPPSSNDKNPDRSLDRVVVDGKGAVAPEVGEVSIELHETIASRPNRRLRLALVSTTEVKETFERRPTLSIPPEDSLWINLLSSILNKSLSTENSLVDS
jgi:hypothetical protein